MNARMTCREEDGYCLERAVSSTLDMLRLEHKSNPFEPDEWKTKQGMGVDHKVKHRGKLFLMEDKNLSGKYFINPSLFRREILSRFLKDDPSHKHQWILIIGKAKFGKKVLRLVKQWKIKLLQLGFKATEGNLKQAVMIILRKLAILFRLTGYLPCVNIIFSKFKSNIFNSISDSIVSISPSNSFPLSSSWRAEKYGAREKDSSEKEDLKPRFLLDGGSPSVDEPRSREFKIIPVEQLEVSMGNIRKTEPRDDLLLESIKTEGVREPLSVYWNEKEKKYLIWDGGRRFRAGLKAGLIEFPCIVYRNITCEEEARVASIKHNHQSKYINNLDMAEAVYEHFKHLENLDPESLQKEYGVSSPREALMRSLGLSKTQVSKYFDIAKKLDSKVRDEIRVSRRNFPIEVLYKLSKKSPEKQLEVFRKIKDLPRHDALEWMNKEKYMGLPLESGNKSAPNPEEREKITIETNEDLEGFNCSS